MAVSESYRKSPAFQFYANDFYTGTKELTVAEVGGYILLLCHQWDTGSLPDNLKKLSQIMRCSTAAARSIWEAVRPKFHLGEDGQWRNPRLEGIREAQQLYYAEQSKRGKASAAARAKKRQPGGNRKSTSVGTNVGTNVPTEGQPDGQPEGQPKGNSPVSSTDLSKNERSVLSPSTSSSKNDDDVARARGAAPSSSLLISPLQYQKLREKNAFVGSRLRVPFVLHDELRTKLGGADTDARLKTWYGELDTDVERTGEPVVDIFIWLRPKFVEWAQAFVSEQGNSELLAALKAIEGGRRGH